MSDILKHVGVLGMRWGHRKNGDYANVKESTISLAKRDAKRHVDAKMFYGDTAGTRRKLLKAEIDKKKKTIPDYEKVLNSEIEKVDTAKSAKKAKTERVTIDTINKGRSFTKKILGITGPLTLGVASMVYYANKTRVDSFIMDRINKYIP
jgi:hypothetical protein